MGSCKSLTGAAKNLNKCTEMTDELSRFDPLHCVQRVRSEGLSDGHLVDTKGHTNQGLSVSGGKGIRTPDPLHAIGSRPVH